MAEPNENLEDEAQAYVEALPDETAAGRLVKDDGTPADEEDWRLEKVHAGRSERGRRIGPSFTTANGRLPSPGGVHFAC